MKIEELIEARQNYERLVKKAEVPVKEYLETFMKRAKNCIVAVSWEQYTPYFNDGEPCEFNVGDPTFYFGTKNIGFRTLGDEGYEDDDSESEGTDTRYTAYMWGDKEINDENLIGELKDYQSGIVKAMTPFTRMGIVEFYKFMKTVGDDAFRSIFGDHVQVLVTASGVTVDEYDHD